MEGNFFQEEMVKEASMSADESPFFFVDDAYPIPADLPRSIQADVDMLERLAKERKEDILFAHYVDLLESNVKCHVLDKKMTYDTGKVLLARYGIHLA